MSFNRRGNYVGDSDPSAEEQFVRCNCCTKMFELGEEGEDETCFECAEKDQEIEIDDGEDQEEYNSDSKLKSFVNSPYGEVKNDD